MTRRVRNRGRIPREFYVLPFQDSFVDAKKEVPPPVKRPSVPSGSGGRKRTREEMEEYWQELRNSTRNFREKTGHMLHENVHRPSKRQMVEAAGFVGLGALAFYLTRGAAAPAVRAVAATEGVELSEAVALLTDARWANIGIRSAYGARYGSLML